MQIRFLQIAHVHAVFSSALVSSEVMYTPDNKIVFGQMHCS